MIFFGPRSKAKDNAGRQTEVVLCGAKEAGLHVICFGAYCHDADDLVVQAPAHRGHQGGVAGGDSLPRADMPDAEHGFSERAELSDGKGQPRTESHVVFMPGYGRRGRSRRSLHEILLTIVAAEVHYDPDPGQHLAFEGSVPSVHVGTAYVCEIERGRARAIEGVTDENISGRWHLRARQTREQNESKDDRR